MHQLITLQELLSILEIGKTTYYEMINPEHHNYVPNMVKPVAALSTPKKPRFSSLDVDNFIASISNSTETEKNAA